MPKSMVQITSCDVEQCSYNKNRACHTMAITVGGPQDPCPCCDTYVDMKEKAGVPDVIGAVGACKVSACQYNESLECSAQNIVVGMHDGHPDCKTYKHR